MIKPVLVRSAISRARLGLALSAWLVSSHALAESRSAFTPAPAPTPEAPAAAPVRAYVPPRPKPPAAAASPVPSVTPAAAPASEPFPPYEPQLMRLGEVMGALSYLRDLCHDGDGASFHDKFAELVDVEAHSQTRKEELAGAFNRGFYDYELTYRACTNSARETIAHYLDESQKIARDVATRYGG